MIHHLVIGRNRAVGSELQGRITAKGYGIDGQDPPGPGMAGQVDIEQKAGEKLIGCFILMNMRWMNQE